MKTLKKLKGVKKLSKTEQKSIAGGKWPCYILDVYQCPTGWICVGAACERDWA